MDWRDTIGVGTKMGWNPLAWITYYLFRVVSLGDVGRFFFVGRKMSHRVVYGPGCIVIGDSNTITCCNFVNCDFIIVPEGEVTYSAMPLENTTVHGVRFERVAFLMSVETFDFVRQGISINGGDPVPIYAKPAMT
jgi:hypothetical protein